MNKLSVVIITLNEEKNIARCIDSVQNIADEIIVVDSFSSDRTVEIVNGKGARVFQQKFEGYTNQKNIAVSYSSNDYVFSIDADEEISYELLESIRVVKLTGWGADAYEMNRLNFFGQTPIKSCGWYPDTKVRIWNKHKGGWQGGLVHEQWKANTSNLKKEKLVGDLLHYSYKTIDDLRKQAEKFAALAAIKLMEEGTLQLLFKRIFSPLARFFKSYILYRGFTEGKTGFYICYYQYRETLLKYSEALKLKSK
jgi:glycosyltransferase involved in cell wall biosynthesis